MSFFENKPKCCCIFCKKELFVCMLNQHINSCSFLKNEIKYKNLELNEDYVICPICNIKIKEINNVHLKKHDISKNEYDNKYPNFPRLSKKSKIRKKHYINGPTEEQSRKLKFSHTVEGYISKYGKEEGILRFELSNERKSKSKTLDGYIQRYGEEKGIKKYYEDKNNKKGTLIQYIKKCGEEEGTKKYNNRCENNSFARTLIGYQNRYGKEQGYILWKERNENHSRKLSRTKELNYSNKIDEYYFLIEKITRMSYNYYINEIDVNRIRSRSFHLDHRISKCYGFINKIHPVIIASKYNLEIKTATDNCRKQDKIDLDVNWLINEVMKDEFYTKLIQETNFEFDS